MEPRFVRPPSKNISSDPLNNAGPRASLGSDGDGIWIEVEAGEFDFNIVCVSPTFDAAEGVAVSAPDIKNMKRTTGTGWSYGIKLIGEAGGRRGTSGG